MAEKTGVEPACPHGRRFSRPLHYHYATSPQICGELKIYLNFAFISNIKKWVEFESSTHFLKNLSDNYSARICPFDKRRLMFEVKTFVLS